MSTPVDAFGAGVSRRAAVAVDDMELAHLAAWVAGGEDRHDLGRAASFGKKPQPIDSVERIGESLRGKRPQPPCAEGAHGADREELGRHGDPEGAGLRILGDDRPGHGISARPRRLA
jgi:hypothetical protein